MEKSNVVKFRDEDINTNVKMQKTTHFNGKSDTWEVGDRYDILEILGKGSYGLVAKAKDKYD